VLGSSRGQQVRMVVHHSRNTEQKQWDETTVLALAGMGRIMRAHLPAVMALPGSDAGAPASQLAAAAAWACVCAC
jgi:hypothetical protein